MSDKAPISNTCPTINSIISKMESALNDAKYILNHPEEDSTDEAKLIIEELTDAISGMEDIRTDNHTLREWGNEEYDRADYAEDERDDALRDKELLEDEVSELKSKIEELEEELKNVEQS